jgi:hypothetical protein
MRRPFFLAGCLLLALLAVAPSPARSDAVDDLAKVLDVVGAIPGVPITGQEVRDSRSLFACIDNAGDDVAVANCLDAFKDTSVGKKAWSQTGLPSWFLKLIDVYIDIREGDFWALVKDAGYTIACAIANVVFAVDVCGIAQAILETIGAAKELISDVVGFMKDIGGSILGFFGIGGGDSGPPLWQVVYGKYLKPNLGAYAEDWLEDHAKFKVEFDVTGQKPQSLLCAIVPKEFGKTCAWLFAPPATLPEFEQSFQTWFRKDTTYAIQMAQAAAVTQAIATMGKKAQEWLAFRHDWTTTRAPADRLRKAYGIWTPVLVRLKCLQAAEPWKQFLDDVQQPEVKAEASKALAKTGFIFQSTAQFCVSYETGLSPKKLDGCVVVGTPTETALKLDCNPGASFTTCKSSVTPAASTKFPPPVAVECVTHALKKPTEGGTIVPKMPVKIGPTPVKPVGMPEGPSPK